MVLRAGNDWGDVKELRQQQLDGVEDYFSRELKEIAKIDATMSPQVTERFWANRESIVHVLAYYRLKLKELSEVLQGGSLQDLQKLL